MIDRVSLRAGLAVLALGFGVTLAGGPGAPQPALARQAVCPSTLPAGAQSLTCQCPATDADAGSVWGSGTYSDDSNICVAALHDGALEPGGGTVRVQRRPGLRSYRGTTANGVTTRDYGAWSGSITFAKDSFAACPTNLRDRRGQAGTLTCLCPAGATGTVWGTGPYTDDSAVCVAARHAGVIGARGGLVRVRNAAGRSSYAGSSANGVTTSQWPAYDGSIVFD